MLWFECRQSSTLQQIAEDRLVASEQMYTKKGKYYSRIRNMYYLYNDFNDRVVHYNQAVQMAAADLSGLLLSAIRANDLKITNQ